VSPTERAALDRETLGTTRERMVRELCDAVDAASARRALVVVLEDLHWADPSSVDVLSALARRRGPARLLVIGSYRPAEAMAARHPVRALKEDLRIHDLGAEIVLGPLGEADVAAYLDGRFAGAPGGLAALLGRHTGGNPLFLAAIADDLVATGVL